MRARGAVGAVGVIAAVGGLALVSTACEGTGPGFRRIGVTVDPAMLVLDAVGATATLEARVTDIRGDAVVGARVTWSSGDEAVARVDDGGVVTAVARGTTSIVVRATGLNVLDVTTSVRVDVAPVVTGIELVAGGAQTGAAGRPLPDSVRVAVVDRLDAPVEGAALAVEIVEGDGSVAPATPLSDEGGRAALAWTLGSGAGSLQRLRISAGAAPVLEVEALAVPGAPARVDVVEGTGGFSVKGRPRGVEVRVLDAFGNGVSGTELDFDAEAGSGTADPASSTTDLAGSAATAWTLGPTSGEQALVVTAGPASARLVATATEPPAAVLVAAGDGQSATVGTALATPPRVRVIDAAGAGVPGVPVTFSVTAGGGSIEAGRGATEAGGGATEGLVAGPLRVATDLDGYAGIHSWTLGTTAGTANQALRAEVAGAEVAGAEVAPVVFTASATAGAPTDVVLVGGDAQTAPVTTAVPDRPTVRVADAWGNAVPGTSVVFDPADGYVEPYTTSTDGAGTAGTDWFLGPVAGPQSLSVTAPASDAPPVVFHATATGTAVTCDLPQPAPGFQLHVCATAPLDGVTAAALSAAVARWQAVVTGDLPDVPPPPDHAACAPGAPWVVGSRVDDLVVYVTVETIDGPGQALAGAAPCIVREVGGLPLFARLRLDAADVAPLDAAGRLVDVLTHELGHALGFGTIWPTSGHLIDPSVGVPGPSPDTHFDGPAAVAAFDAAGGAARTIGSKVPVQNTGGNGIADVHWRESVMDTELLTSALDAGGSNPLSAITVGSLTDLGYIVAVDAADPFVVPFPNLPVRAPRSSGAPRDEALFDLSRDIWWGPIVVVDARGLPIVSPPPAQTR